MGYKLLSYLGSFESITHLFPSLKELKERVTNLFSREKDFQL